MRTMYNRKKRNGTNTVNVKLKKRPHRQIPEAMRSERSVVDL